MSGQTGFMSPTAQQLVDQMVCKKEEGKEIVQIPHH